MNRIERLAAILLLLQERPHTSLEIAGRFEVSRRTILRDVQALSEMGVPVIAREGPGGGYTLPQEYHAGPLPLTGNEAFLLLFALASLERLSDLPFKEEFASLRVKLRAQLPQRELSGAEGMLAAVDVALPERQQRAPFLEDLMEAARVNHWVRVVYQSSQRISTQHLLPRQVYTQDGFWYLLAYSDEHRANRTFRVDRVQAISAPEPDFEPQPVLEPLPYEHESHPIVSARFTQKGADLMETDRHLGGQVQRGADGGGEIAFHCPPEELDYFARWFASMGEEVTVLGPPELCQKLRQLGQRLVERYPEW